MKNPVLLVMSLLAGLSAALGLGVLQDLVSPTVLGWLLVTQAVVTAAVQYWLKGQVTPVASPRAKDGTPLVPASPRHAAD
jgi:hypothetical protein